MAETKYCPHTIREVGHFSVIESTSDCVLPYNYQFYLSSTTPAIYMEMPPDFPPAQIVKAFNEIRQSGAIVMLRERGIVGVGGDLEIWRKWGPISLGIPTPQHPTIFGRVGNVLTASCIPIVTAVRGMDENRDLPSCNASLANLSSNFWI